MKRTIVIVAAILLEVSALQAQQRFITRTGQATIFSHTVAEDISAVNNTVTGTIDPSSAEVTISVPVQSFQFEKTLMQEHFNNPNFMDSKQFPRISFKGKISNAAIVDFTKNGKYSLSVPGELTIRAITKPVVENAVIEIENGKITVNAKFVVQGISSYGVGKPMGKKKDNVADDITVTYSAVYEAGE